MSMKVSEIKISRMTQEWKFKEPHTSCVCMYLLYMHLAKDLHPGYIKNFYYGTRKKRQMCNPIKNRQKIRKDTRPKKKKKKDVWEAKKFKFIHHQEKANSNHIKYHHAGTKVAKMKKTDHATSRGTVSTNDNVKAVQTVYLARTMRGCTVCRELKISNKTTKSRSNFYYHHATQCQW